MSLLSSAELSDQAFVLIEQGQPSAALSLFEQVCELDENNAEAWMMRAVLKMDTGALAAAEKYLDKAHEIEAGYADVFYYFACLRRLQHRLGEAKEYARRAIELDADYNEAKKLLLELQSIGEPPSQNGITSVNEIIKSFIEKGDGYRAQNKLTEAISVYREALQCKTSNAAHYAYLGRVLYEMNQYTDAVKSFGLALNINEDHVVANIGMALVVFMQGRVQDAYSFIDKALQLEPENISAIALAANIAKHLGNKQKAFDLLAPVVDKKLKDVNVALAFAMISKDFNRQQDAVNLMEVVLETDQNLTLLSTINLHFNLGNLYDNLKQYDKAFVHYKKGNDLKPISFNKEAHSRNIDHYIKVQRREFLEALPKAGNASDRPVFVVGMVRSGTSLIEQILSTHPDVFGAGELSDVYQIVNVLPDIFNKIQPYPDCMSLFSQAIVDQLEQKCLTHLSELSADALRVVDKLPGNFMHLGLIQTIYPGAKVIHCKRNPLDTCLSTYFQDFSTAHPYAYDLENLQSFYKDYLRLMTHWREVLTIPMLEVSYEDLVMDQESVSRQLLEFCGLEWNDECMNFHTNKRYVKTASYDQVNRPIYQNSIARWKNYETHLSALLKFNDFEG